MIFEEKIVINNNLGVVPVRFIKIDGTNFDIGYKLAELAISRFELFVDYHQSDPIFTKARYFYFKQHYPIHWARMKGAMAMFNIAENDYSYDFSSFFCKNILPTPSSLLLCSAVYYPPEFSNSSGGYLSRNFESLVYPKNVMHKVLNKATIDNKVRSNFSYPYIMHWKPSDAGYESIAIHSGDILSDAFDGINSQGLSIAVLGDGEAMRELGKDMEKHRGMPQAIGLHELQIVRLVLDTCATVEEAKFAILSIKQYFHKVPCNYIVADKFGNSFIYEGSTGRNMQYIIDGNRCPQAITNFQLHKCNDPQKIHVKRLTFDNHDIWRYQKLVQQLRRHKGVFTADQAKFISSTVNFSHIFNMPIEDISYRNKFGDSELRTLWHSLYNLEEKTAEFSFYLDEDHDSNGKIIEHRSKYLKFKLD